MNHKITLNQQFRPIANVRKPVFAGALFAALLTLGTGAQAQSDTGTNTIGLQVGRSDYNTPCGSLYGCDRRDTAWKLSLGRNITPHFGAEVALMDLGNVGRAGGDTTASTANFSLVGRIPVDRFTLFGKLGANYARSKVNTALVSDLPSGKASGWGPSGGLGVSYDLTPRTSMVAEWDRQRIEFAGTGRSDVDSVTVGLRASF